MKSVAGREPKEILAGLHPLVWSTDSRWLACATPGGAISFVRVADGREVKVSTPGMLISVAASRRKLLFYQGSYEDTTSLKVVSIAAGRLAEFGWPRLSFEDEIQGAPWWTADARKVVVAEKRTGLWILPIGIKNPLRMPIDTPLWRKALFRLLSPDGSRLLLAVPADKAGPRGGEICDLWVAPLSLAQRKSSDSAIKVFSGLVERQEKLVSLERAWSPDSSHIAFSHKTDIWVVSVDGSNPRRLTATPEHDELPEWSPDGATIAFCSAPLRTNMTITARYTYHVVPSSGGEARQIADLPYDVPFNARRTHTWSPNGKALTIASAGVICEFPIAGGAARTVLRPKDAGIRSLCGLKWSPDGHRLAFHGVSVNPTWFWQVYVYRPDDVQPELFGVSGAFNFYSGPCSWSSDNKWLSFFVDEPSRRARKVWSGKWTWRRRSQEWRNSMCLNFISADGK